MSDLSPETIAELFPCKDEGQWQDIATAPRGDGDEGPDILVFGRIDPRRGHRRSYYIENSHWYRTGFTVEFMDGHEAPTHWRPLPSPPQVKP